jgi:hypothetical protein
VFLCSIAVHFEKNLIGGSFIGGHVSFVLKDRKSIDNVKEPTRVLSAARYYSSGTESKPKRRQ